MSSVKCHVCPESAYVCLLYKYTGHGGEFFNMYDVHIENIIVNI